MKLPHRPHLSRLPGTTLLGLLFGLLLAGCPGRVSSEQCSDDQDCPRGFVCAPETRRCLPDGADAGTLDASIDAAVLDSRAADGAADDSATDDSAVADSATAEDASAVDATGDDAAGLDSALLDATGTADAAPTDSADLDATDFDAAGTEAGSNEAGLSEAGGPTDASASDAEPLPQIIALTVLPTSVEYGSLVSLSFSTLHATACRIDGAESTPTSDEVDTAISDTPQASHSYEIVCTGPGGTTRAVVEVTVTCTSDLQIVSGDRNITDQAQLTALGNTTSGCWRLDGNLSIRDSDDIFSLGALVGLVGIGGNLEIVDNRGLEDLAGLEALQTVGDNLFLGRWDSDLEKHFGNPVLTNIEGLSGLHSVGTDFRVQYAPLLPRLGGLQELRSVGADLLIQYCDELASVRPLRRLQEVGGYLWLEGLPLVEALDGLQALRLVGSFFGLVDMSSLVNLTALRDLSAPITSLYVRGNPLLTSLSGLQNTVMSRNLEIRGNPQLQSLSLLPPTVSGTLRRIHIVDNDSLVNLAGLESLVQLEPAVDDGDCSLDLRNEFKCPGMVYIAGNRDLASLAGLNNLHTVVDSLLVHDNPALLDLVGLGSVVHVGHDLVLYDLPLVTSAAPFTGLNHVGHDLDIRRTGLVNLLGFEGVTALDNDLNIRGNDALVELTGLSNLAVLLDDLTVKNNDVLLSLAPLVSLVTFGEPEVQASDFIVENNPELIELGLNPVCSFAGPNFYVRDNPSLPTVDAVQLSSDWIGSATGYDVDTSGNL